MGSAAAGLAEAHAFPLIPGKKKASGGWLRGRVIGSADPSRVGTKPAGNRLDLPIPRNHANHNNPVIHRHRNILPDPYNRGFVFSKSRPRGAQWVRFVDFASLVDRTRALGIGLNCSSIGIATTLSIIISGESCLIAKIVASISSKHVRPGVNWLRFDQLARLMSRHAPLATRHQRAVASIRRFRFPTIAEFIDLCVLFVPHPTTLLSYLFGQYPERCGKSHYT